MACIRTVKPDFWTDEKVVELSFAARLLFIGLWNFADNSGRMYYSPKRIKMQIFPADKIDITPLLTELQRERLVVMYSVEGQDFLQVINFSKHQKTDPRYESKLPAPPNHTESHPTTPNPPLGNGVEMEMEREHTASQCEPPPGLNPLAWEKWIDYRKQIRKPLKPASIPAAQRQLAAFGSDQVAVVEQSVANGWQGLFALKQGGKPESKPLLRNVL